jgi:hypothetical protein
LAAFYHVVVDRLLLIVWFGSFVPKPLVAQQEQLQERSELRSLFLMMSAISPYFGGADDDGRVLEVPSPTDSAGTAGKAVKKTRHVFNRFKGTDKDGNAVYHFLDTPDVKEYAMYSCLAVSKPFATTKWNGVTAAWTTAVNEINQQSNMETGRLHFDPPVSMKTVRERFEGAMKIVKELSANVPFRSGEDDEEEPSQLLVCLEDLYEQKTSFDTNKEDKKDSETAKKKKSRNDAKAIQEA